MENHTPELRPGTTYPDPHKRQTPAFITHVLDRIGDKDLTADIAFFISPCLPFTVLHRGVRSDGRQSINSVLRALLANVDIATSTVTASQSHLAKQSEGLNLSPPRFYRALKRLERAGIISFSRSTGRRAAIVLTELALGVYGISQAEWYAAGGVLRGKDSRI